MTYEEFIEDYLVDFAFKPDPDAKQSDLFSDEHVKYRVKFESPLMRERLITTFQCNRNHEVTAKEVLDCLHSDVSCTMYHDDFISFGEEFGYEDMREARRIFDACKKIKKDLLYSFGEGGFEDLMNCEPL